MDEKQAPKPSPRSGKNNTIRLRDTLDLLRSEFDEKLKTTQESYEQKVQELNKKVDALNHNFDELTTLIETLTDGLTGK